MKQSAITTSFIMVCIAVLLAAYGVGLGVRKIRGVDTQVSAAAEAEKPSGKSESDDDEVAADTDTASEPSEEVAEEPQEEFADQPERPEGRRMMGGDRMQNMSEEERQEFMARMRERGGRGRGGGGFSQLSEEDRAALGAEMQELRARAEAGEIAEEDMRQASGEILEKYGISRPEGGGGGGRPGGGEGGRRRSGGGGGAPPAKGRACFVPDTGVWVDGKLVQISKVAAGQTIGRQLGGALSLEQIQEHEGTFECRDIVLESGNTIGVVDAHCFMLDSGRWIAAQNLRSGLRLKTLTGTVGIKSVTKRAVPYTGKVYNLKVKNSDRYLVGKDVVIVRDY